MMSTTGHGIPLQKLFFSTQQQQNCIYGHSPHNKTANSWRSVYPKDRENCLPEMCRTRKLNIYSINTFLFLPSLIFLSHSIICLLSFSLLHSTSYSSLLVFQSDWRCSQQPFLINRQHCLLRSFALSPLNGIKKSAAFINRVNSPPQH